MTKILATLFAACGASGALYALIAFLTGWSCLYSCFYRTKMRRQYSLPESPCPDIFVHCCCELCALCQEYRELKGRGFDMSIGTNSHYLKIDIGRNLLSLRMVHYFRTSSSSIFTSMHFLVTLLLHILNSTKIDRTNLFVFLHKMIVFIYLPCAYNF